MEGCINIYFFWGVEKKRFISSRGFRSPDFPLPQFDPKLIHNRTVISDKTTLKLLILVAKTICTIHYIKKLFYLIDG